MRSFFLAMIMLVALACEGTGSGPSEGGGDGDADGDTDGDADGDSDGDTDGDADGDADGDGGTEPETCAAVDVLFVIDNSASMTGPQEDLAAAFPAFIDSMFDILPDETDLHVGITTSSLCDFSVANSHSETNCVPAEDQATVESAYITPDEAFVDFNGWQGRLLEYEGLRYFEANTFDPSTKEPLKEWFSGAATSVGASGCSFEFNVGGAGWVFSPTNADFNEGFIRDAETVLLLFFLTNEADHTNLVDDLDQLEQWILDAKSECGGAQCIVSGGLLSSWCVDADLDNNFKFLSRFGEEPVWGSINDTNYEEVVGDTLAQVVGEACDEIIIE